jgi:catechol 2,3-dioxygenase-like lactoylglutathione lyase family enzyme
MAVITRVAGTSLWSEDSAALAGFYRDVLGLPELHLAVERGEGAHGYYNFGAQDGPWLGIGQHSEIRGRAADAYRHLVALQTTDIHADVQRLKAKGVEFIEEPQDQGGGFWIATLKDPDGNLVQLYEGPVNNPWTA